MGSSKNILFYHITYISCHFILNNKNTDAVTAELQKTFKRFNVKPPVSDTEDDSNEYEEVFNPFIERNRSPMKTRRTARKNRDFRVPQPSARAQPQDSTREQRYHTRLDENESIKRERCNTDTVDHIFNTMSQIYKQARKYYRKKPEHVLLHIVVLLWTIILFAIMTK